MPIRPEHRYFYPIDWPQLSAVIRFGRAGGRCEACERPHGQVIVCLEGPRRQPAPPIDVLFTPEARTRVVKRRARPATAFGFVLLDVGHNGGGSRI